MGEILTTHIRTDINLSDFMTKVTFGQKRRHLVGSVLYDLYDDYKPIGAAPRWHLFGGEKGAFWQKRVLLSMGYGFPRRKKSSAS